MNDSYSSRNNSGIVKEGKVLMMMMMIQKKSKRKNKNKKKQGWSEFTAILMEEII